MSYTDLHDWDRCTRCGACLALCPVMKMDWKEAGEEVDRLIGGDLSGRATQECTLCYTCNELCPIEGLEPYDLMQQRVLERRGRIPSHINYFLNTIQDESVWTDIFRRLSPEQQRVLNKWGEPPPPAPEMMWIGCLARSASPTDIDRSRVLADLPKYGPYDLCCGEVHYRLGGWDEFMRAAEKTYAALKQLRTERLVCYCHACSYFLSTVYPKVFGEPLPYEVTTMYEWLWERMQRGELTTIHPLDYDAAVCESCNLTEMDPELPDKLVDLYRAAGMRPRELAHRGKETQTCGFAVMGKPTSLITSMKDVMQVQRKKYRDVAQTGTRNMALCCGGCRITFGFTNRLFFKNLKHMPEELLHAFGDDINEPISKACDRFLGIFAKKMPRFLLGR